MFEPRRPHHRRIMRVLAGLDGNLFSACKCYFGGGTAIALLLDEFRVSVDIDFLCSDRQGYAHLRSLIDQSSIRRLFTSTSGLLLPAEVRLDRDSIRGRITVDDTPIKFEIIRAGNTDIAGQQVPGFPVDFLSYESLVAEKLLANIDRWLDAAAGSKDIVDLCMLKHHLVEFPDRAIQMARDAYNLDPIECVQKACARLLGDLNETCSKLGIEDHHRDLIFGVCEKVCAEAKGHHRRRPD